MDNANIDSDLQEAVNSHQKNLTFRHTHNGMIIEGENFYGMIEFKIDCPNLEYEDRTFRFLFDNTLWKSTWFHVDAENQRLIGPLKVDAEKYTKTQKRFVLFDNGNVENGEWKEISDIDEDPENLIDSSDIPQWMMRDLWASTSVNEI